MGMSDDFEAAVEEGSTMVRDRPRPGGLKTSARTDRASDAIRRLSMRLTPLDIASNSSGASCAASIPRRSRRSCQRRQRIRSARRRQQRAAPARPRAREKERRVQDDGESAARALLAAERVMGEAKESAQREAGLIVREARCRRSGPRDACSRICADPARHLRAATIEGRVFDSGSLAVCAATSR
jgi:hypothetical protein